MKNLSRNSRDSRTKHSLRGRRSNRVSCLEQLENRALLAAVFTGPSTNQPLTIAHSPVFQGPAGPGPGPVLAPPFPYDQTFLLNSRPGAAKTIFLDFDGYVTTGTAWNTPAVPNIVTPAFDFDGNPGSFSNAELERIQRIWERVSEDYAPFEVNVTTQFTTEDALIRTSTSDQNYGMRAAIGGTYAIVPGVGPAGGVAYVGVFGNVGSATYSPAFVFSDTQGNDEQAVAETVSHEIGHTLGLSHDGTAALGYYSGHGTGATSWGPIMGAPFTVSLSQWSRDTYPGANNPEDDLAIISGPANGFGYRTDDFGNSLATATPLQLSSAGESLVGGLIEQSTDEDWLQVLLPDGVVTITATGADRGSNLDILLQLRDSNGTLVAIDNPIDDITATITTTLRGGTYYVSVAGTGKAATANDPGYPRYGSLGQWFTDIKVTPSSHVQGTVYLDRAGDGARQAGDQGAAGFTVFIDDNLDGIRNVGESSAVTDANGFFDLLTVAGTRNVRVELPPGYVTTDPRSGFRQVVVGANAQIIGGVLLGIYGAPGQISGHKWMDYNSNASLDPAMGDGPLGGIYIFVDIDNDGRPGIGEPAAVTASDGSYIIKNVPIGTYSLKEILVAGTATAFPTTNNGSYVFTMTPGANLTGYDFFNSPANDYGDAPDSYQTLLASGGPVHGYMAGYQLGARLDADANGQPTVGANGDDNTFSDDEDGIKFLNFFTPGATSQVQVTVNVPANKPAGYLNAFVDFNRDGDFNDAGEKIFDGVQLGTGVYTLNVNVPASAVVGTTYTRFRYGSEASMGPGGRSAVGEVEDYATQTLLSTPIAVTDGDQPPLDPQTADISVRQLSLNNPIDVLANDIRSARGNISIVPAPFAGTGKTTDLGGKVTISNNGTPADPTDDYLLYDAAPVPASSAGQTFYVDHFKYTITDGFSFSTADVYVTVNKLSTAPVAIDDTYIAKNNTAISNNTTIMNVLANDLAGKNMGVQLNSKMLVSFDAFARNAAGNIVGTITRDTGGTPSTFTDDRLIFKALPGVNNTTGQFTYTISNPQDQDPALRRKATVTVQIRSAATQPDPTDDISLSIQVFTVGANGNPQTRVDSGTGPYNIVENGEYWVGMYAKDLRGPVTVGGNEGNGALAVYLDFLYDARYVDLVRLAPAAQVTPAQQKFGFDIRFSAPYNTGSTSGGPTSAEGSATTPGIIDEIGNFALNTPGDGFNNVFFVKFKVKDVPNYIIPTVGVPFWRTDPADKRSDINPNNPAFDNDIIVNDEVTGSIRTVPIDDVAYLPSANFKILPATSAATPTSVSLAPTTTAPLTSTATPTKTTVTPTSPAPTSTSTGTLPSQTDLLASIGSLSLSSVTSSSPKTTSVSTQATDSVFASLYASDLLPNGKKK